ncbi:MAG: hypothetical protein QGH45_01725, partial [Myxococcota bacterium]|nr:hypothetical protein [Myxococcota bacterium]
MFDDTDDIEPDGKRGMSTGLFTFGVLVVLLALTGVGAYVMVPDLPDRIRALIPSEGEPSTPGVPESDVPTGERVPVWIDARGEEFHVGFSGPCPAEALCLDGLSLSDDALRPLADVRARPTDPRAVEALQDYVRVLRWMDGVGPALVPWQPAGTDARVSACAASFPGGRVWIDSVNANARGLVPLAAAAVPGTPYKISDLADDLVTAVADGQESWNVVMRILWPAAAVVPHDPLAPVYPARVAAAIELGLATNNLPEIEPLQGALRSTLAGGETLVLRLPSEPSAADARGGDPSRALVRDLTSLADIAGRRGDLSVELCVSASAGAEMLGLLRGAVGSENLGDRIVVCDVPLAEEEGTDVSEACIAARQA